MIPTTNLEESGRLKALFYGGAGAGKTTAALQMPRPYVIDTEKGAVHYKEIIKRQNGAVYYTNSLREIVEIVKALATEKHDYLTLVIDPVTTIWKYAVDEAEARVGAKYGRHIGEAKKLVTKLENYMSQIDMNVICTSRAKDVFNEDRQTMDAWKGLDYFFDIIIEIERQDNRKRFARIEKSRMPNRLEELSRFEWSYDTLAERFGREDLERGVKRVDLDESSSTDTQKAREDARVKIAELSQIAAENAALFNEEQSDYIKSVISMTGESAAEWEQIKAKAVATISHIKTKLASSDDKKASA